MSGVQIIREVEDQDGDGTRVSVIGSTITVEQETSEAQTAMIYTPAQAREVATALLVAAEAVEVTQ